MRLLILGGTWFLGRCIGELALAEGWSVTTFNRGVSAPDLPGVQAVHERAVVAGVGADRAVVLRPGVILGPNEYVGRLTWWLSRAARGGQLLTPAPAARPIQPVDVRDVAAFALHCATATVSGPFNVTAPYGHATFGDMIDACIAVTGAGTAPMWADPAWLIGQGVQQWTELPLWRMNPGVWAVDSSRAAAAGLVCRPLHDTVSQTWTWMTEGGTAIRGEGEAGRAADHGLSPAREHELLQDLTAGSGGR